MDITTQDLDKMIERIPKYKEPFVDDGIIIGYPFCLTSAISSFGKEVIPDRLGIYHLFFKGNLVYIGMSQNLRGRLLYHLKHRYKVFDGVLFFESNGFTLEEILTIEANMIKKFTPSLNISHINNY
jgi:excinuclease UvrABC nuclease subunit